MDYAFNELSLTKADDIDNARTKFLNFAEVCKTLFSKGFRGLKIPNRTAFLQHELVDNVTIDFWLRNFKSANQHERSLVQSLRSIITGSSKILEEKYQDLINVCPLIFYTHDGSECTPHGIKIACIIKSIAVSIDLNAKWDSSDITALLVEESGDKLTQQEVSVFHASKPGHFIIHQSWFTSLIKNKKLFSDWNPSEHHFPNLEYSNECVNNSDWRSYYTERDKAKNAEERRSIILKYGNEVALRNGYLYDQKVSALNSTKNKKRKVYQAGIAKQRIYLSIDLETGGFEVCDYSGSHLGEFFYDGNKVKTACKNHSINV